MYIIMEDARSFESINVTTHINQLHLRADNEQEEVNSLASEYIQLAMLSTWTNE